MVIYLFELNYIHSQFKLFEQYLIGVCMDGGVILTTDHKNIKKYGNFIFVNNGSRASYEEKVFLNVLPTLIKGYSILPSYSMS